MFEHALVARSWLIHEIARDGLVTTVLHVELATGSNVPSALTDAIIEFMKNNTNIDRAEVAPNGHG